MSIISIYVEVIFWHAPFPKNIICSGSSGITELQINGNIFLVKGMYTVTSWIIQYMSVHQTQHCYNSRAVCIQYCLVVNMYTLTFIHFKFHYLTATPTKQAMHATVRPVH